MKHFRFPLDRVLKLRTDLERQRVAALGEALRVEEESSRRVAQALVRLEALGEQAQEHIGMVAHVGTLRNLRIAFEGALETAAAAAHTFHQAVQAREREWKRWSDARIQRRVLERLREQRLTAWEAEHKKVDQREVDEVALRVVRQREVV